MGATSINWRGLWRVAWGVLKPALIAMIVCALALLGYKAPLPPSTGVEVAGTTHLSALSTTGDVTVGDDLTVTDDAAVGDDLTVTDDAAVGGALAVTGASTLTGAVTTGGALTIGTIATIGTFEKFTACTVISPTDGAVITPTCTYQRLSSAGEVTPTITTTGITTGTLLVLINTTNTTINLADTGTAKLSAAWAGGQYDALVLWFDGTNWIEISRSDN